MRMPLPRGLLKNPQINPTKVYNILKDSEFEGKIYSTITYLKMSIKIKLQPLSKSFLTRLINHKSTFFIVVFFVIFLLLYAAPGLIGYSSAAYNDSSQEYALRNSPADVSQLAETSTAFVTPSSALEIPTEDLQQTDQQVLPTPTRTRKPTATPRPIPPPADISKNRMMIGFGVLAVVVVVVGVWINRRRTF